MKKTDLPLQCDFSGKVAVVTGAGGVICSMLAEALSAAGAKVALLDLNEEKADAYAQEIVKDGASPKATGPMSSTKPRSRPLMKESPRT